MGRVARPSKGTFNDTQLVSKIFCGLTPRYNNFVDQYHLLNEDVDDNVKAMTNKLLTYESKLLEWDAEKNTFRRENASSKGESEGGSKIGGHSVVCAYKPCEKANHTEDEYFIQKRHQAENATTSNTSTTRNNETTNDKDKRNPKKTTPRADAELWAERGTLLSVHT